VNCDKAEKQFMRKKEREAQKKEKNTKKRIDGWMVL